MLLGAPGALGAAEVHVGRPVMGTVLQITVVADTKTRAGEAARDALATAKRWDDVLTTWRPEGELARLNAAAGSGAVAISADLERALRAMEHFHRETGGAFDAAVAPPEPSAPGRWPDAIELRRASAALASGAAIDSGGIGKGIACDAIVERLSRRAVAAAFVDFGRSSIAALGSPEEEPRGWPVVVAGLWPGESHGVLFLRGERLSTSRSITDAGARAIVDPVSGERVREPRLALVVGADAARAEAWSTALVVLGRAGIDAAARAGVEVLYQDRDGLVLTSALDRRLSVTTRASAGRGSSPRPPS